MFLTPGSRARQRFAAPNPIYARERLTANRTYYVRTDGAAYNNGLTNSAAGAFATLSQALAACATIDFAGYTVTIKLGAGTFTLGGTVGRMVGQALASQLIIDGAGLASTTISTTSANCLTLNVGMCRLSNVKLTTATSGYGVFVGQLSAFEFVNVDFGATVNSQLLVFRGGYALAVGAFQISGGAERFLTVAAGGLAEIASRTVTFPNPISYSVAFYDVQQGHAQIYNNTYSGGANVTGKQYSITGNGAIQSYGLGGTVPGTIAGTTASGGQYL